MDNYKITINKENRKTLVIKITPFGQVEVYAPTSMPDDKILEFINQKRSWISSKLTQKERINDEFNQIINGEKILLYGKSCLIIPSNHLSLTQNYNLFIDKNAEIDRQIKAFCTNLCNKELTQKVKEISDKLELNYAKIKFSNAKSKWGSCDKNNEIMLNWRLIMLPSPLIEYVIIHELCHTIHFDHSKAFWHKVSTYLPNYKQLREELAKYSYLTLLYNK